MAIGLNLGNESNLSIKTDAICWHDNSNLIACCSTIDSI